MSYTPGPWKVRDVDGSLGTIETADGKLQIGQTSQLYPTDRETKHAERIANARLIAAAPELVEALEYWANPPADYNANALQARVDALLARIRGD